MSMRILCSLATIVHICEMGAQANTLVEIDSNGATGAISLTDELALEESVEAFQSVAAHNPLMRAELDNYQCELPAGAKWCTARSGGKSWQMAVYASHDPVSKQICKEGFWEHEGPKSMGVSSGDHFLDIGANVGWYTFMFAQHGFSVLAVEPMTANRALLKATMCKNPELVAKINVVAAALTDKVDEPDQKCSIFSANINLGDGILACGDQQLAELRDKQHNNKKIQHVEREQVPLTTLNQLLASSKLTNIDFVKMDVERYECQVLDGASTLFTRFHPKVLMIETRRGTSECTVKAVMKGGKYKRGLLDTPVKRGIGNLLFSLEQE